MKTRWFIPMIITGIVIVLTVSACRLTPPTPVIIHLEVTEPPAVATPTHRPPIAAATLSEGLSPTPTPALPGATPIAFIKVDGIVEIPITIGAVPQKLFLGPCSDDGGYLVEIIPGLDSPDGAYVVTSILPEADGRQWNDVLTFSAPGINKPVKATARIRRITGWQEAGRYLLELQGGKWSETAVASDASGAGYLLEINPLEPQPAGERIEQAEILPEYTGGEWRDGLRIRTPAGQQVTPVEVVVYTAPGSLLFDSYELALKPGDWPGTGLEVTGSQAIYLVGIQPLQPVASRIATVIVQQEFDGRQWNTVMRAALEVNQPFLRLRIRVYRVP